MKYFRRIPVLIALLGALTLLAGCGHTNNLAKYDTRGKSVTFRTRVNTTGSSIAVVTGPNKEPNAVIDIAAAIGSGILTEEARKKLERAVDADSIAANVSLGMRQAVQDYLNMRVTDNAVDASPDFLVETELTEYQLISTSAGICARVSGKSRMIERATGGIVWENSESRTIPLSQTILGVLGGAPVRSATSIFNAIQLMKLTEEQMREVINQASVLAGREIGETLREDVAKAHGK